MREGSVSRSVEQWHQYKGRVTTFNFPRPLSVLPLWIVSRCPELVLVVRLWNGHHLENAGSKGMQYARAHFDGWARVYSAHALC